MTLPQQALARGGRQTGKEATGGEVPAAGCIVHQGEPLAVPRPRQGARAAGTECGEVAHGSRGEERGGAGGFEMGWGTGRGRNCRGSMYRVGMRRSKVDV
mmetsp:Transcript_40098/g.94205  ORF Transcript_40098/g.94205 Transcript_40098/m.94205 type:complete len:100 (+) Transcript_40098:441-740(+)